MAGEWQEITLGSVIGIKHGYAFPGSGIREEPPGDVLLTPGNFAVGGGFKGDKFKYFLGEVPDEFVLAEGDLLVTMTDLSKQSDTLGFPAIVPKANARRFLHNQRLGKVEITSPSLVDSGFLFYLLRTAEYRHEVLASATGTTVKHTSPSRILSYKASLPPLPEQKRIAHILGTLDDKIELNRRMNATLEGISRAIFKSWFVDFDPVRQKAAGRQPVGMDAQTAALFPDSFEDSEIGEVPKGWATCTLDDYTQVVIGGDWGESGPSLEAAAACLCVRGADIPSLQAGGVGKLPTRYLKAASLDKRRLSPWDLVVEISGGSPTQSTGRPVLVTEGLLARLSAPLIASNFCRILKLKEKTCAPFIYFYLRHLYDADEFLQYENGTTGIKNFAYTLFAARHPLLAPDHRVLAAFAAAITPTVAHQQQKARESDFLAALRDTLPPKLLSGEIRVPEAERAIEEATT
jgi:type I restriction enzyme S subunit